MIAISEGKRLARKGLAALGVEVRRIRSGTESNFSNFDEEAIIRDLLQRLSVSSQFVVDIGAGDGATTSNTYALFKAGWRGVAAEWDGARFAQLAERYASFSDAQLVRTRVTPDSVLGLFRACEVPNKPGFLSLDIDSYDHYVLERILSEYRPSLICAEINEKFPPPLKFTVKWDESHSWRQDHFFGQSLEMLNDLAARERYDLVGLEYNNAFLVPQELNTVKALTTVEAYRRGYADRADRFQRLPWNKDMEPLQTLAPAEAVAFVRSKFAKYEGRYVLELAP